MLRVRKAGSKSAWVFPGETEAAPILGTSLDHGHDMRDALGRPKDFVIHSLRHTILTRLGEAAADAFTIKRIAGHSTVTVSQRYVHTTPGGLERAFERLENLNAAKFELAEAEAKAEATGGSKVPTNSPDNRRTSIGKIAASRCIKKVGPLAQRLEQRTHNPLVEGSNPSGPTNKTKGYRISFEILTGDRNLSGSAQ